MPILGSADISFSPLLRLQHRQSRREARCLLVANKQRVTPSGGVEGVTRRAGTLAPQGHVASRLCGTTTLRSFASPRLKRLLLVLIKKSASSSDEN